MSGGFFMPIKEKTILIDGTSVDRALIRISHQILEKNTDDPDEICLLGIKTRGAFLAEIRQQAGRKQDENSKNSI